MFSPRSRTETSNPLDFGPSELGARFYTRQLLISCDIPTNIRIFWTVVFPSHKAEGSVQTTTLLVCRRLFGLDWLPKQPLAPGVVQQLRLSFAFLEFGWVRGCRLLPCIASPSLGSWGPDRSPGLRCADSRIATGRLQVIDRYGTPAQNPAAGISVGGPNAGTWDPYPYRQGAGNLRIRP